MLSKTPILGVSVTTASKKQILSFCSSVFRRVPRSQGTFPITVVTPNAEQIVLSQDTARFRDILNSADIALPDGKPIEWMLKKDAPNVKRISGIDFVSDLCQMAVSQAGRVFLVGGSTGVAKRALGTLQTTFPGLDGIAQDGPVISETSVPEEVVSELIHTIRGRNIRIVFLGFGAPKQEYLLAALEKRLQGERVILMVVGGSFDVISGVIKRAPTTIQSLGLEWLWRLLQEPWRWKRQLALLRFIRLVCSNGMQNTR